MTKEQQAAPNIPSLGMARIRARSQDSGMGVKSGLGYGARMRRDYTCGSLDLEPFEVDGNKATDQGESQQSKQAANFCS